jgi:hypothetical protein
MVNLHDDLVYLAITFRGLHRPTEIGAMWPVLLAGLRDIVGRVKATDPLRRRSLRLGIAIDWCHQSLFSVPLSEEAWAEAEGLVAELKAMAGHSVPRGGSAPRRSRGGYRREFRAWAARWTRQQQGRRGRDG